MSDGTADLPRRIGRRLILELRRLHGRAVLHIGAAGRTKPLCPYYGFSRGKPVDRYYIEAFLEANRADIRGRVLEVADDTYSRRFGGEHVTRQEILHRDPDFPGATLTGDIAQQGTLPERAFDCIILTQTLQLIYDLPAAAEHIHRALRPGGVALITVPGITSIDRGEWKDSWYWSLTVPGLERLLHGSFAPEKVSVSVQGNLYAATAFLLGASLEEVSRRKLDPLDPAYPVIVAARAVA